MSSSFYQLLKQFIWPRYREEGPPKYLDTIFYGKGIRDSEGNLKEPIKSILDLIVLGYRPVTSLSILMVLVENRNRPMYGSQIGDELEKRFQLPEGWFTKTRYYDTRIGKILKILCRLDILEETEIRDQTTKRRYLGYRIIRKIYPTVEERTINLLQGGSLSILAPSTPIKVPGELKGESIKHCPKCQAHTTSPSARYCEICGTPLKTKCLNCGKEMSLEWSYCLNCGKRLE